MGKVLADYVNEAKHWLTAKPERKAYSPFEQKSSRAAAAASWHKVGVEQYPPRKYTELVKYYRTNPIVRRATKLCAESVAAIEPVVKVAEREDHAGAQAIRQLMQKPNPRQSQFDFMTELAAYLKLSGNGWVEANPGAFDNYIETYALRPDRMRITPGPTGAPQEFIYDPGTGRRAKYWDERGASDLSDRPGLIMHIKDFAPDDDLRRRRAGSRRQRHRRLRRRASDRASPVRERALALGHLVVQAARARRGCSAKAER